MQEGLDLKGKEGTIIEVIEKLNDKPLSANLPYKTQFLLPVDGGKEQKLIAHLVRSYSLFYTNRRSALLCACLLVHGTLADDVILFAGCWGV